MENKEKDLYLAKLLEKNAIKQDEFEDIEYKPEINAFCSKYLSAIFIDNINFGWSVWQAKATPEGFVLVPREPTLKMSVAYEENAVAPCSSLSVSGYKAMIEAQEQSHD